MLLGCTQILKRRVLYRSPSLTLTLLGLKRCRDHSVRVINLSLMFPQLITHNKVPGLSGHLAVWIFAKTC